MELDKGPHMIDKTGVCEKKWISQKWLSNETNKQTNYIREYIELLHWAHEPNNNIDRNTLPNHLPTSTVSLWWRHQIETFSALLALCAGNSPVTVNSPHKGQWRGTLMFSLICALNKPLSKQSRCWWFETPSHPLWRHCNGMCVPWYHS